MKKKIICIALSLCIIVSTFFLLQALLVPKYRYITSVPEGALIGQYYDEEVKDHDVVFVGDCEVYENVSPITLWQKYGIRTYTRGSAQQLIWQSYYLMEDTLKYERPDVFVFNVLSMKYGVPQNEAYNRLNIEGMKWSSSKLGAIKASMMEDESLVDYILPILRYHTRWNQLTADDFKYWLSKKPTIGHNGFLMRVDSLGVDPKEIPEPKPLTDYQFSANSYKYLNKMVKLCKENGVKLVLMKAPTLYPAWYDEWDKQMEDFAKKNGVDYYNFLENQDEIGLDWKKDTYDKGLHLNTSGAEKMATYFGKILHDKYNLKDSRKNTTIAKRWAKKVKAYNDEKKAQYAELKKYGYLKSWGAKKR